MTCQWPAYSDLFPTVKWPGYIGHMTCHRLSTQICFLLYDGLDMLVSHDLPLPAYSDLFPTVLCSGCVGHMTSYCMPTQMFSTV